MLELLGGQNGRQSDQMTPNRTDFRNIPAVFTTLNEHTQTHTHTHTKREEKPKKINNTL